MPQETDTDFSRPLRVVILGLGARGRVYSAYAERNPSRMEVLCAADTVVRSGLYPVFPRWEDALAEGARRGAEAAVIALPDSLHASASAAAMRQGLDILLEKPFGCSMDECDAVRRVQRETGRLVLAGYVLRFSPYYRRLARIVASGEIGDIVSIHHLASIGFGKASHAFCRGNWSVEANGASALVQKCSHDFDLIGWWTGGRRCRRISSFGSLVHWRPENAPEGSSDRCVDCAAATRAKCPFDAERLYVDDTSLRYHFAAMDDESMRSVVSESPYGRCVYRCGNDAVDHQTVMMEYEGGIVATLSMEFYTRDRVRLTRFFGTRGEIAADGRAISVRPFIGEPYVVEPHQEGTHGGGDDALVRAFIHLVRAGNSPARNARIFDSEMSSHRLAFAAEEARRGCQAAIELETQQPEAYETAKRNT